jgi:hypothetical protein
MMKDKITPSELGKIAFLIGKKPAADWPTAEQAGYAAAEAAEQAKLAAYRAALAAEAQRA